LIERSFQGLSIAIETVRIDEELMEIWPNEVCDTFLLSPNLDGVNYTLQVRPLSKIMLYYSLARA